MVIDTAIHGIAVCSDKGINSAVLRCEAEIGLLIVSGQRNGLQNILSQRNGICRSIGRFGLQRHMESLLCIGKKAKVVGLPVEIETFFKTGVQR